MGEALRALPAKRDELVISTKLFRGVGKGNVNALGLSRKKIIESAKNSLKRMGLT
jgi:aryl-alcohol dehydrogenase-like predicted oxidoreductase